MYHPVAVANDFIRRAQRDGLRDLDRRKLQDLLYCAHGWSLGILGRPLLRGEFLATEDGPLLPVVDEAAAGYGTKHIAEPLGELQVSSQADMRLEALMLPENIPERRVLDITWKAFGALSPFELSRVARTAGGPWEQVWSATPDRAPEERVIETERLRRWFSELAQRNRRRTRAPSVADTQRIDKEFTDTKRLRPL